jgi:glutamate synthase domain-containing protein 2/glutamate synthase domain-containing protein 1/glutamate synthase domain-containing protein 3
MQHGNTRPRRQGLYYPENERDACGVGFVAQLKGERSHFLIDRGLSLLSNLAHRGACGADPDSGDGAGILIQLPDRFLRAETARLGIALPPEGRYASGLVFLSEDSDLRTQQVLDLEQFTAAEGQTLFGWRAVPHVPEAVGRIARERMPVIRQVFIGANDALDRDAFERRLYTIRRQFENQQRENGAFAYVASLSSRTFVYTGMLLASQLRAFYPDLSQPALESALALVHSRYSTNTFPEWDLAQPFRYLAHNGEINTLKGNRNAMRAREGTLASQHFGDDLAKLYPILREAGSDSAQLDNMLEFLCLSGRELAESILMLIPEAWENHTQMDPALRAFYEYHSFLIEPWDGPASIAFSDGRQIGAVLDRNGLRPARYVVTKDDLVIMASEVGALEVPAEDVVQKERLHPGKVFVVDLERGQIIEDAEVKARYIERQNYRQWIDANRVELSDLPPASAIGEPMDSDRRFQLQQAFGYTSEDLKLILAPMAVGGRWAIGSMGEDAALACLSDRPRMLYDYFKQQFAQVTNPAMDSINEAAVMSLYSTLGAEKNLLSETPEHARILRCARPVLTDDELARIREIDLPGFRAKTVPTRFKLSDRGAGLRGALDELCRTVAREVLSGVNLVILSDRGIDTEQAPIPMLLATGAVHHHLVREGLRTQCGILCETGEARDIAHFALLLGFGAGAINPYLALATVGELAHETAFVPEEIDANTGIQNFLGACDKGLLKTMAKMGISTLQSYRGAQIFEAVGLDRDLVNRCFSGAASRVSGVGYDVIAEESAIRHRRAFADVGDVYPELETGGLYQWRLRGERHAFNPDTTATLQHAVREDNYETYRAFSKAVDAEAEQTCTLRGIFRFRWAESPVPIHEVEPASEIVKRFCTGAMSYGSISLEAHQTRAIAMNRIGARSNTGEGGEDPARFTPDPNGDSRRSAIKQVASGRFGVTSWYLVNADELQIKIAQGAKPGEGGELPGHKVDAAIARTRHSTPGVGLISPPPHHDIYSIEDLAQLIYDLKNANRHAQVSVKLVAESGVGAIAAGVSKGRADGVLIAGHDGGTGASPLASIKHAGVPWEIGLAEAQQTLILNDLRGRIRVQADGGLKTARDVAIAALLGADEFGFATAPLVAMGCVLMRVCHLNTCPVGIATQDPVLRSRFAGQPEHVIRYFFFVAEELREILARLGCRSVEEIIGRADHLDISAAVEHWKASGIDLSELLHRPAVPHAIRHVESQSLEAELNDAFDSELIERAEAALVRGEPVEIALPIRNIHRTVGTMLGAEVSRRYGAEGLPEDTIRLHFQGSAGQSFGAFCTRGITLEVTGDSNDYCGKGLCGAKLIVRTPERSRFDPAENIITGNVALYGATSGEAYFEGVAGERFCIRNSGADAVVEGVGDHGCEYMTGGRVLILGKTGRNFGAGMCGGIAYVLDTDGDFAERVNPARVDLERLQPSDIEVVQHMIRSHLAHTGSERAREVLRKWEDCALHFVKVHPRDLKRAHAVQFESEADDG